LNGVDLTRKSIGVTGHPSQSFPSDPNQKLTSRHERREKKKRGEGDGVGLIKEMITSEEREREGKGKRGKRRGREGGAEQTGNGYLVPTPPSNPT